MESGCDTQDFDEYLLCTMTEKLIFTQQDGETLLIKLSGEWTLADGIPSPEEILTGIGVKPGVRSLAFDTAEIGRWDDGLLVFLRKISEASSLNDVVLDPAGLPRGAQGLLKLATAVPAKDTIHDPMETSLLNRIGDVSLRLTQSWNETQIFVGEAFLGFLKLLRGHARLRPRDLWEQMRRCGADALPIVTLILFLIGVILGFTAAIPLRMFGAEIYIASLVGIAIVRELAPMMTAIILAGRSGAAFAAELGTMTVNEEIDALRTAGFSPMEFLVMPRLLALGLMMPLLSLYADFMGILGGAMVSKGLVGISYTLYMQQTIEVLDATQFQLGAIKAFIYGILVAVAGCMRGMQCGRSASAVGQATTSAVVTGIVYIIVASAVTTVIYSLLGY
jgi:phospholipid/cholesterol/gamma-HCH transport system permease protein